MKSKQVCKPTIWREEKDIIIIIIIIIIIVIIIIIIIIINFLIFRWFWNSRHGPRPSILKGLLSYYWYINFQQ
jgi:heme/copper-type cytochrome/quinol oxidase subunit 2